jgi:hypothetical protein
VPLVWLNVEFLRWSVCMGAGVFGISVYRRPRVGLFGGRCVNGVMCVC